MINPDQLSQYNGFNQHGSAEGLQTGYTDNQGMMNSAGGNNQSKRLLNQARGMNMKTTTNFHS